METEPEEKVQMDGECDVCHKREVVRYYGGDLRQWLCDGCRDLFFPEEEPTDAPATI